MDTDDRSSGRRPDPPRPSDLDDPRPFAGERRPGPHDGTRRASVDEPEAPRGTLSWQVGLGADREPDRPQHLATGEGGSGDWQRSAAGIGQRGVADPGPEHGRRSDERIRDDVREHLAREDGLDANDVSVDVKDGQVTLTGTVADRPAKQAIESLVARCRGVTGVDNRLKVMRGPEPGGPPRPHASVPQDSPTARDEARGRTSRPTPDASGYYG